MKKNGYLTSYGYRGFVPGIGWMEFATEEEYYEYIKTEI